MTALETRPWRPRRWWLPEGQDGRVLDARARVDEDATKTTVLTPSTPGTHWLVVAVPVPDEFLDDRSRTPMQVALDVGRAAMDTATDIVHSAVLERRRAC